jgi:hypothetical protein
MPDAPSCFQVFRGRSGLIFLGSGRAGASYFGLGLFRAKKIY